PSPTHTSTLSLHDALPICLRPIFCAGIEVSDELVALRCRQRISRIRVQRVDILKRGHGVGKSSRETRALDELFNERVLVVFKLLDRKSTRLNSSHVAISYA